MFTLDCLIGPSGERGRDGSGGPSGLLGKKNKPGLGSGAAVGRPGVSKQITGDNMVNLLSEEWENIATDVSCYYSFQVFDLSLRYRKRS